MLLRDSVIRIKAEFFSFVMPLSKDQVTTLIRKRRKKTLYDTIAFLQLQAYDHYLWLNDARNSRFAPYVLSSLYPNLGYVKMRPKDVPDWAYRSWYSYFVKHTPYYEWSWHPRDHEWLLSHLLE